MSANVIRESAVNKFSLLSDCLDYWAEVQPEQTALIFLENGEDESARLNYRQLREAALRIATALRERELSGESVLLVFHSSLEYVTSFLACLYANVRAVPVYPPRQNWHAERLMSIVQDSGAKAVLTTRAQCGDVAARLFGGADTGDVATLAVEDLGESALPTTHFGKVDPETVAYLQYTSGSTGSPKGVMVRHRNLVANCELFAAALGVPGQRHFVSWLPIYHDMGLVAGIVLPLTLGGTAVFMPPPVFVQKPERWLRAVDRYRAVFTPAPNFAYELCANRISDDVAATLDLSSLHAALNGAEPIAGSTLDKFCARFAASGFARKTFAGGFGMAEATLYVTCGGVTAETCELHIDKMALERDRVELADDSAQAARFVSSGRIMPGSAVRIVDPSSGKVVPDLRVGEIWVAGDSICAGYWKRDSESEETFGGVLDDRPDVRYLRTGDLGFVHANELYVTGRLKDLIIIRGANHYPQDIERSAECAHAALRQGGWGAAFVIDTLEVSPRVVVVQEVERAERKRIDPQEVGRLIADAVTREHGIEVDMVVLVPPASVPKTSSGKIQRRACRQLLLDAAFDEIGRWTRPIQASNDKGIIAAACDIATMTALLKTSVARLTGRRPEEIPAEAPFVDLALDSMRLVEFIADLSSSLQRNLPASLAFEYPSVAALAAYLAVGGQQSVQQADHAEPIAIVGMGCRFPQADGLEAFWDLLMSGESAIREIPTARAELTGFVAGPDSPYRFGGFIDDVDRFDAAFFNISPREAQRVDPQQRLLLETAWHALEHAGVPADSLAGSMTGVFIGICANDYFRLQGQSGAGFDPYAGTGSALSVAANRLSYTLGLQGPSMAIDTACSSSLVAIHQACRSLSCGESTLAIAGGVNLILCNDYGDIFAQAGMLAPDGQCKTFDAAANGYVRGEGCGVVVLKRLADAQRDGDRVLAVIRGSAVNQDGFSNGLTAPNGLAQQRVIRSALARAGVDAQRIGYVETHGTGTSLGDPIEVRALRDVFDADGGQPCWLGALKTQIGHLEAAAGVAGLIKSVLSIKNNVIPANRNFGTLNPQIDLQDSRLAVTSAAVPWQAAQLPRCVGISSFGFGGTNSHIVIEEYVAPLSQARGAADGGPPLFMFSARDQQALRTLAADYAQRIDGLDAVAVRHVAATVNTGRASLSDRAAIVAESASALSCGLRAIAAGEAQANGCRIKQAVASNKPRTAFLYTGQGAQYVGMGRGLYETAPVFRASLDRCAAHLGAALGDKLTHILFAEDSTALTDTRNAQPALVALQIALTDLWAHWGVKPQWVCGHSVGEYAAAYAAGIMDAETALDLVVARASAMSEAPGQGAMASVACDENMAQTLLGAVLDTVEIAGYNSPGQIVLSGEVQALDAVLAKLEFFGIAVTRLAVSHAFHSRMMEPVLDRFAAKIASARLSPATIPVVSTGGGTMGDLASADYWVQQIRRPVCFTHAIEALLQYGADTFVEIGPKPVLSKLGQRSHADARWIPSMEAGDAAALTTSLALGAWFVAGGVPRLPRKQTSMALPSLPRYPFAQTRYWFEQSPTASRRIHNAYSVQGHSALIGARVELALPDIAVFSTTLPGTAHRYLLDHCVAAAPVMPAAAHIALAVGALKAQSAGAASCVLKDISFLRPLPLQTPTRLQTVMRSALADAASGKSASIWHIDIVSEDASGQWQTCAQAQGVVAEVFDVSTDLTTLPSEMASNAMASSQTLDVAGFYADWAALGLQYGPQFRGIQALHVEGEFVRADLQLPVSDMTNENSATTELDVLHPALIDAAMQSLGALLLDEARVQHKLPLPVSVEQVWVGSATRVGAPLRVTARVRERQAGRVLADLSIVAASGHAVLEMRGLTLAWIDAPGFAQADTLVLAAYPLIWEQVAVPQTVASATWGLFCDDGALHRRLVAQGEHSLTLTLQDCAGLQGLTEHEIGSHLRRACMDGASGALIVLPAVLEAGQTPASCVDLQRLLCAAVAAQLPTDFALVLVTQSAALGAAGRDQPNVAHAAMAAMWRSAALEYVQFDMRQIDLPTAPRDEHLVSLLVSTASAESELAVTDAQIYAPRLSAAQPIAAADPAEINANGIYLITGGTGALGLQLAEQLVAQGARHLCLVSRRGAQDAQQRARLDGLRASGANVNVIQADLATRQGAEALFAQISAAGLPLVGIFHAAGVTQDAALAGMTPEQWETVFAAKARAALWLDELSRDMPLQCFVMFSSVAASLGSAGQTNYAAANGVLDALAWQRRSAGLPAVSIAWGAWGGEGMAASVTLRERLARQGVGLIDPSAGAQACIALRNAQTPGVLVGVFDWPRVVMAMSSAVRPEKLPSRLRGFATSVPRNPSLVTAERPTGEALLALDKSDAYPAIQEALGDVLAAVLKLVSRSDWGDATKFANTRLSSLGMDSLMAMEVRNQIRGWIGVDLPAHLLIGATEVAEVVELIYQKLLLRSVSQSPAREGDAEGSDEDMEILVL
ncbi:MAG: beta-ketoacyl synthase [Rhodocyclales bacterium]|nr:beta-ketoacyl synthase [Rhodocyclales bacterium]